MGTRQQLFEEKSLLARFAEAAGSGDDLKAAYENEIGHATSDSTIYNLLHLHGWRKLMPRPFQFGPGSGGGTAEPAVNVKSNLRNDNAISWRLDGLKNESECLGASMQIGHYSPAVVCLV